MRTLAEAKAWLLNRVDEGERCPLCTQNAKVYRRKINSGMARALIEQYRLVGQAYAHTTSLCPFTHEAGQLAWWGLFEQESVRRPDGGRSGWWRITDLGKRFVSNEVLVPRYARIYDGRLLNLVTDERVSIIDALGARFDYRELMAA